jgi:hypothetical protein
VQRQSKIIIVARGLSVHNPLHLPRSQQDYRAFWYSKSQKIFIPPAEPIKVIKAKKGKKRNLQMLTPDSSKFKESMSSKGKK